MKKGEKDTKEEAAQPRSQNQGGIRLPGFINDGDVGLGDLIKRATHALGVKPCGECERRAARLNRWLIFSGKNSK
jgi:hypothetical protein